MKLKTLAVVLVLTVFAIWVTGWTAHSQKTDSPKTWEYKVVTPSSTERIDLDKLGEQGWELVALSQPLYNGSSLALTYYFKRPK